MITAPTVKAAVYAALAVMCFGAGWVAQGWRLGDELSAQSASHAKALSDISAAAAVALSAQQAKQIELANHLAALDAQHYQELIHAQSVTSALSADLAASRKRLPVRVSGASCSGVPARAGPARVDDGAERADLHPATAASAVAIAGEADQCAVKLTALQAWVIKVAQP